MAWRGQFQIGPLGYEASIPAQVVNIDIDYKNIEIAQRVLTGDMRWRRFKILVPTITLQLMRMNYDTIAMLAGFFGSQEALSFICNGALSIRNQQELPTDTTHITLSNCGASGIAPTGVFLRTDPNNVGANYYTGGSYDSGTRILTLGSALPNTTDLCYVSYSFSGHLVKISQFRPKPHQGIYHESWQAAIELTGT